MAIEINHATNDIAIAGGGAPTLGGAAAGGGDTINIETLAADKTLTNADDTIQFLDPDAATRTVTLPAEEADLRFLIQNRGTAVTDIINIVDDAAGAVYTIEASNQVELISDGTRWYALGPATMYEGSSTNTGNVVIGDGAAAPRETNVVIGKAAKATSVSCVAVGPDAIAGNLGIAIGRQADADRVSAIAIGDGADASFATSSIAIGLNSAVTSQDATYAIAIGGNAEATGRYSIGLGRLARANRWGEINNNISGTNTFSHLRGQVGLAGVTTTAGASEIFCAKVSNRRFDIEANSVVLFKATIVGRDSVTNDKICKIIRGAIAREGANTTALVGTPSSDTWKTNATFDAEVAADSTNDALIVNVTPTGTNSTNWSCNIEYTETR